jgi:hypothetical protein
VFLARGNDGELVEARPQGRVDCPPFAGVLEVAGEGPCLGAKSKDRSGAGRPPGPKTELIAVLVVPAGPGVIVLSRSRLFSGIAVA